jgi:regulation of enolase protein 1 (concanavalin A-like superfamily)
LWTVVNPAGGTVSLNGTDAVLSLPAGTQHDLWTSGNQALRIMQNTTDTDFQAEVKFDSLPSAGNQDQGIIVQTDVNNYIRFDMYSDGSTQHMFAASFVNNNPTVQSSTTITGGKAPFWLRVKRAGNVWTSSWSVDGTTFTTAATFTYALVVNQIGPYAGNCCGASSPAFTEYIDYFFNSASPITPADGGMWGSTVAPTISGVSATSITTTGATVQWTTNQFSNTRVDYGTTTSYGVFVSNSTSVLNHSMALTGLTCGTLYHYKVT